MLPSAAPRRRAGDHNAQSVGHPPGVGACNWARLDGRYRPDSLQYVYAFTVGHDTRSGRLQAGTLAHRHQADALAFVAPAADATGPTLPTAGRQWATGSREALRIRD